ncbi:LysR family transcriptional regulator [Staphylococcus haemolyticus]|uniref:LysR family transcriptional regulator n=1 Tax=Staphylococcus haemolyticus TaxID=1283 RepID=UPI0018798437|nr:LysR family transcriptional regulator [Staphylococcus haemolyticus]MBE7342439.1 LysR family transcriptional regulator [Staphylococcus haemolyticus]
MELRNLRYFLTVVEASSISKAAKILNITQPTLSRQLKELEIELGAELFKREPKGIKLTEDGIFLKNRSEEILSLASKTQQEFDNKKKQELAGHITIGCVEADNSDTLAMILEELTQDYPRITFHISSGTSEDITERLDKGLLDIAILLEPISVENYEKLSLPRTERWGLLVPRSSNLANNNYIMPQMLKQTNLLVPRREEIQNMIASWCTCDINDLRIVGTYNLIFNIFTLVENNIGSAIVIEGATSNRNVNNQLKFIPLSPVIQTNCVLIWKKSRILTPVLEEFIKRFKEIIKS